MLTLHSDEAANTDVFIGSGCVVMELLSDWMPPLRTHHDYLKLLPVTCEALQGGIYGWPDTVARVDLHMDKPPLH